MNNRYPKLVRSPKKHRPKSWGYVNRLSRQEEHWGKETVEEFLSRGGRIQKIEYHNGSPDIKYNRSTAPHPIPGQPNCYRTKATPGAF